MMKRTCKSLLSLLLVVVMAASLMIPAMAAGTPKAPTAADAAKMLKAEFQCSNANCAYGASHTHQLTAEAVKIHDESISVIGDVYYCDVEVIPGVSFNGCDFCKTTHTLPGTTANKTVTFKYNPATTVWQPLNWNPVVFTVDPIQKPVVNPGTTPAAPSTLKVQVTVTNGFVSKTYTVDRYGYDISAVSKMGNTYTCTVTLNTMGLSTLVSSFNADVNGKLELKYPNTTYSVTMLYNGTSWKPDPVTFTVEVAGSSTPTPPTGRYTVTYQWRGEAPYGATLPVDTNTYAYGDYATVAYAPKDVNWNVKDGTWKWDPINNTWYWDNYNWDHNRYYQDRTGYWVFEGWEMDVVRYSSAYPYRSYTETVSVYPGQKIKIEDNTTIYGTWSYVANEGTLVLTNEIKAPIELATATKQNTFEIYASSDMKKPYKTVKLANGEKTYITLPNGTYYIYEVDASIRDYNLTVSVSGDLNADGQKFVINGNSMIVKYVNTYSAEELMLDKDNHVAYLTGYADGTVHPNANITREEVAMMLYRLMTSQSHAKYDTSSNSFTDVKATRWSNTAISTLSNAGIINGYADGSFKPGNYITRAEMAAMVAKFSDLTGGISFTDTSNHWAAESIRVAAKEGWVTGYKDGSFKPNQNITRAEVVTIINRMLDRNPSSVNDLGAHMTTFTDNAKTTAWYYLAIQEAANTHNYVRNTYGVESWR